ncbi:MAG: antibiotic biosynthesis monooxygenase [Actinomycetota bacterium]|nr:antibiotic biosynthesis monooxygenase [Actinomycetota bacterium]
MPTPTDDRRDLLTVIAYMRAAPGRRDELRSALEVLVEPTSKEKGYINYDLHQRSRTPTSSCSTRTASRAPTSTRTSRHRT